MKCSHDKLRWDCDSCSREAAEKALGEIMVLCGYVDPAEGEGTSPEEIVKYVARRTEELERENARLQAQWQFCGSAKQSAENDRDYLLKLLKQHNIEVDIEAMPSNYGQAYVTQIDSLRAALKECAEALKEIEALDGDYGTSMQNSKYCPCCHSTFWKTDAIVHYPNCKVNEALSNPLTQSVLKEK